MAQLLVSDHLREQILALQHLESLDLGLIITRIAKSLDKMLRKLLWNSDPRVLTLAGRLLLKIQDLETITLIIPRSDMLLLLQKLEQAKETIAMWSLVIYQDLALSMFNMIGQTWRKIQVSDQVTVLRCRQAKFLVQEITIQMKLEGVNPQPFLWELRPQFKQAINFLQVLVPINLNMLFQKKTLEILKLEQAREIIAIRPVIFLDPVLIP